MIVRVDPQTGAEVRRYNLGDHISGVEAGATFNADGRLLIPGIDSGNVLALSVGSGQVVEWVGANRVGLEGPRVLVRNDARQRILVSSWGSNQVIAFNFNGTFIRTLIFQRRPSGLALDLEGNILVASEDSSRVVRYSPAGVELGEVTGANAGGLAGATFLALVGPEGSADDLSQPDQLWLVGVATLNAGALVADMLVTDGASFGADFDPTAVQRIPWGRVNVELLACNRAVYRWESDNPAYGSGEFELVRVAPNRAEGHCEREGVSIDAAGGAWFGGPQRDGEGLLIDVLNDAQALITIYSYRPAAATFVR